MAVITYYYTALDYCSYYMFNWLHQYDDDAASNNIVEADTEIMDFKQPVSQSAVELAQSL